MGRSSRGAGNSEREREKDKEKKRNFPRAFHFHRVNFFPRCHSILIDRGPSSLPSFFRSSDGKYVSVDPDPAGEEQNDAGNGKTRLRPTLPLFHLVNINQRKNNYYEKFRGSGWKGRGLQRASRETPATEYSRSRDRKSMTSESLEREWELVRPRSVQSS